MNSQGNIDLLSDLQVLFARIPASRLKLLDSCSEVGEEEYETPTTFAEPVPAFDHSKNKMLVVLIVNDAGQMTRAAVGRRGYSGGTGLSQIQLSHARKTPVVSAAGFAKEVEPRFSARVRDAAQSMGLLPPGASRALLNHLLQRTPEIRGVIEAAHASTQNPILALPAQQQIRLQQESDAALTAMLIAGIDRDAFLDTQPDSSPGKQWFLEMVTEPRLREDPMIINDLRAFPGFSAFESHISGAVRFQQERVVLTVLLVNRQPLEKLTGTDLIYYNETFRSFVMVQYKAIEKEGDDHVFRLPNTNLGKEIRRMMEVQAHLDALSVVASSPHGYRLNRGPFFMKFCPRHVPQLAGPDLVPGMYFTLEHWGLLEADDSLLGPKDGRVLKFQKTAPFSNAGRYLNNTEFSHLVSKAWVGTTIDQSAVLEQIIQQTLQSGRSVTLAREVHGDKE